MEPCPQDLDHSIIFWVVKLVYGGWRKPPQTLLSSHPISDIDCKDGFVNGINERAKLTARHSIDEIPDIDSVPSVWSTLITDVPVRQVSTHKEITRKRITRQELHGWVKSGYRSGTPQKTPQTPPKHPRNAPRTPLKNPRITGITTLLNTLGTTTASDRGGRKEKALKGYFRRSWGAQRQFLKRIQSKAYKKARQNLCRFYTAS